MQSISKKTLPNGVTLYIDPAPHFRSASVVVAIIGGSRLESPGRNGATHLIEHLLFKQTARLSARQIAEWIDDFGGDVNAFTDSESFCLYGTVIRDRALDLLDFLSKLLIEPAFSAADVEIEKEIVRQEILEAQDDTADLVSQAFRSMFWKDDPLGQPVFGTVENLERMTHSLLREHLQDQLKGRRMIIAVSGVSDESAVEERVHSLFGEFEAGERPQFSSRVSKPHVVDVRRPGKQTHLIVGWNWPPIGSPHYLAGLLLSSLLGYGASSRLFRVLREEQALCYDLGVHVDAFPDSAVCLFTSSFETKNYTQICESLRKEVELIRSHGISDDEFERTRRMLRAQLEMEEDSPRGRLWRAVESEIALGRYVSADEVLQKLAVLTRPALEDVAKRYLGSEIYAAVGGRIPKKVELELTWQ